MIIGFVAGAGLAAMVTALLGLRARRAAVKRLTTRVAPLLERQAAALGVATTSNPSVGIGRDGELVVDADDEAARLVRLCDAIEERDHGHVGYVDTLRVSKDEVDGLLKAHEAKRNPAG
jgi:hypothetical protein